jgi:hypothetical protein
VPLVDTATDRGTEDDQCHCRLLGPVANVFACGAGDGNRTRTVSLGIRYGPAIYAPVAGSDVAVSDLS